MMRVQSLIGMLGNMRMFGFTNPQSFADLHVSGNEEELILALEAMRKTASD